MGKAVVRAQTVVSFKANATLSAYRVVTMTGANQVGYTDTTTASIVGVTAQDSQGGANSSVAVVIAGTAKCICASSVSAGAMVTFQSATSSGLIMEASAISFVANTTATATNYPKILGRALQAGSTNSVIEIQLQINNVHKTA